MDARFLRIVVLAFVAWRGTDAASAQQSGSPSCVGDCIGNGQVTVDELITGVNIGLGNASLDQCPVFDANADGQVTVDELITAVNNALSGCPVLPTATPTPTLVVDTRTPTVLSGLIEVPSFTIDAGELAIAAADLTIRATGEVRIDGDLRAGDAGGQTIVIDAGGAVSIAGSVVAGNGHQSASARGNVSDNGGGDVIIQSDQNIVLSSSARLAAGDGVNGGDGGDVVLHAPSGSITIPDAEDLIHIGNGGDGASLQEDPLAPELPEQLDNRGGDSGLLILNTQAVGEITVTTVILTREYRAELGDLVLPAGEELFVTTSTRLLSGGRGGNAGTFNFGPEMPPGASFFVRDTVPRGQAASTVTRRGAGGGDGFLFGGAGADVVMQGLPGAAPGDNGQSVVAVGGDGGACLPDFDTPLCEPGPGGDAHATGGNGAPGAPGGGAGGIGGQASALGGDSFGDRDEPQTFMVYGTGGDAEATGGEGGLGGNACPPQPGPAGGAGGAGGAASAAGGNAFSFVPDAQRGFTLATGGAGGKGGPGVTNGGPGGAGGMASLLAEADELRMGSRAVPGAAGQIGGVCPPLPTPTATPTPGQGRPILSFSTPIIHPFERFVLVAAAVGTEGLDETQVLLRLRAGAGGERVNVLVVTGTRVGNLASSNPQPRGSIQPIQVLIEQGQTIPNSTASVQTISSPNSKFGDFALLETTFGDRSVVQITEDGTIVPWLGVGTAGERADHDPRSFVVPLAGGHVFSDTVGPNARVGIVAAPFNDSPEVIPIIGTGDPVALPGGSEGAVTEIPIIESVFGQSGGGTGRIVANDSVGGIVAYSVTGTLFLLLEGYPIGFEEGVIYDEFLSGLRIGGGNSGFYGFLARVSGPGVNATSDERVILLEGSLRFGSMVSETAIFTALDAPVMGPTGAAILHRRDLGTGRMPRAIAFVPYVIGEPDPHTIVVAGDDAPGGGVFADFPLAFAIHDGFSGGRLIFRAELEDGGSAYYVADVADPPRFEPQRLVGTGDAVSLPQGGTAVITSLGMIPATGGFGGEPTALNETHFTLTGDFDNGQSGILLVELPSPQ